MKRDPKLTALRSELRRLSMRGGRGLSKARSEALARQRVMRGQYHCEGCGLVVRASEVEVDHKIPCGELKTWADLGDWCERLFCGPDGLQILCRECHHKKTHG